MSSYSVKMITRMSFQRAPGLRQVRAHVLPHPLDEPADPGVGQAAGRLGDLGHLVEQLLLAAEELPGGRVGQRAGRGRRGGGDLGLFLGLEFFFGKRGPVVVVADGPAEKIELAGGGRRRGFPASGPLPTGVARCGGGPGACGRRLRWTTGAAAGGRRSAGPPRPASAWSRPPAAVRARSRYSSSRADRRNSGASGGRPSMSICTTLRFGKAAQDLADVVLEPPDHHVVQHLLVDRHAAAEPLGIEDFQQGREAIGVAVVRRGGEEQPVLEPRRQVADGAGDLRVDGVLLAAGRGGVVGLVEDQQRAAAELAQPVAQAGRRRSRRSAGAARRGSGCGCPRGSRRSRVPAGRG